MKRILVLLVVLFSIGFSKDLIELGKEAYDKGDYQKAAQLFQKACDSGEALGCSILGILYKDGQGVKQDYQKAAQLYQKVCDSGEAFGCFSLGVLYQNGLGVKQNFSTAKQYYGKVCDLGDQLGCDNYRKLNEKGY
ncbi:tetratricopeptide repeat protein [Campylobacter concisus]